MSTYPHPSDHSRQDSDDERAEDHAEGRHQAYDDEILRDGTPVFAVQGRPGDGTEGIEDPRTHGGGRLLAIVGSDKRVSSDDALRGTGVRRSTVGRDSTSRPEVFSSRFLSVFLFLLSSSSSCAAAAAPDAATFESERSSFDPCWMKR